MATTYEKIATTTLGSTASSITFSSIASSWTDLRLVWVGTRGGYLEFQYNGDTAANYSYTWMDGSGSAAASGQTANDNFIYLSQRAFNATIPEMATIDIFSYASSNYKTCLTTYEQDTNGAGYVGNQVGLWRSTSAITSISIIGGSMNAGTTATLYGIKAA
jgi:hypothetical protein